MPLIRIAADGVAATIDSDRGGRLASLAVGGRELLVGPYDDADRSIRWGCYLMAPWPGRLADASFEWEGRTIRLPRTYGRHAIHGLVWDRHWIVESSGPDRVSLSCLLPRETWPMGGTVRQRFTLAPTGLRMDAEIEADEPMPAALGWHPWFRRLGDVALRIDADATLETRQMLPTGRLAPVAGTSRDLRTGPVLGQRRLDAAYVGVRQAPEISWPDLTVRLETDPVLSTVVVYTPNEAVCVEPQTAWPDALRPRPGVERGGPTRLDRGGRLRATLRLGWELSAGRGPRGCRPR
jgi:aldose 1-epimerase